VLLLTSTLSRQNIATPSEMGDESAGPYSAYAGSEATLGDLSPDAL
jgi:hypothetical protein